MKILFTSSPYYPLIGGIQTQTRMLTHELSRRRHEVEVAALRFRLPILPKAYALEDNVLAPPYQSFVDNGVMVHALVPNAVERARLLPITLREMPKIRHRYHRRAKKVCYPFFRSVFVPKLRKVIQGKDIVHTVAWDYMGWATEEAARAEGVPFVVSTYVHPGQWGDEPENVAYYNRADRVFSLLESDREKLVGLGVQPEKLRLSGVVPLLPETSDSAGFRARHGVEDDPLVVYVGGLRVYKGAKALLDAAEQVWQNVPNARFIFIGPGFGEGEEEWFARYNGDARVKYLGLVDEQEKADALAACDVFSMPSTFEILPAVYLEAWSYGKPVVGGTAHGLKELIEGNEAGRIVDQDPTSIARIISELLLDQPLREEMGRRGQALVRQRYSKEALVRTLEETYEELLLPRAA